MEDFDVGEALRRLRNQKTSPYECPLCFKLYQSFSGISYHITRTDHSNQNSQIEKKNGEIQIAFEGFRPIGSDTVDDHASNTSIKVESPLARTPGVRRQPLTYAEAQKLVEFDIRGEMIRFPMKDEMTLEILPEEVKDEVTEPNSPLKAKPICTPRNKKIKFTKRKGHYSVKKNSSKLMNKEAPKKINLPAPVFKMIEPVLDDEVEERGAYYRYVERSKDELDEDVEYDMDEEDYAWLEMINEERKKEQLSIVSMEVFELLMDRLEKESHFETQTINGDPYNYIDEDAVCCICNDGECSNSNVILFCDMCNLAVHQECYGVPYIPEGQWLCRRCLQSPSKPVDCVLCPNKNGAFKQTDDNRWSHVTCALWIPEVCFANTVFLEPIDSIQNIPPARWKLVCYICKKREGACIQCFKTNCYVAFHVTCAQQAGLHMKIEPTRNENGQPGIKKSAFCDNHTPHYSDNMPGMSDDDSIASVDSRVSNKKRPLTPAAKLQEAKRKLVEEKKIKMPVVHIPFIPPHRLAKIVSRVVIAKKAHFIQKLQSYWMLKRQSRNGVPLLRRLQASTGGTNRNQNEDIEISDQAKALKEQLKYWQQLRHDLERARLLIELIRKREKMKREQYKMKQQCMNIQLQPLNILMKRTLDQLQTKDTSDIFAEPVPLEDAPDYLEFIKTPMDFSTIRTKIDDQEYKNFDEFEADFQLMIDNCMTYNAEDTIFYKAATRLRHLSKPVWRIARKRIKKAGIDPETGLHASKQPTASESAMSEEDALNSENIELSYEDKIADLEEKLELASTIKNAVSRSGKQKMLRKEIMKIRRSIRKKDRDSISASSLDSPGGMKSPPRKRAMSHSSDEENSKKHKDTPDTEAMPNSLDEENQEDNENQHDDSIAPPPILNPSPGRSRRSNILFNKRRYRPIVISPLVNQTAHVSSESEVENPLKIRLRVCQPNGKSTYEAIGNEKKCKIHIYDGTNERKSRYVVREDMNGDINGPLMKPYSDYNNLDDDDDDNHRVNGIGDASSESDSDGITDNSKFADALDSPFDSNFGPSFPAYAIPRHRTYTSSSANSDSEGIVRRGVLSRRRGRRQSSNKKPYSFSDDFGDLDDIEGIQSGIYLTGPEDNNSDLIDPKKFPEILNPLDLVWAKCRGYPSYPAMSIDPNMPRNGLVHNGVPIPVPPIDVLKRRNPEEEEAQYLVLFFDVRRTWQWLTRGKLEPLGVDSRLDRSKLIEGRKSSIRKSVQQAYERAIIHKRRVLGNPSDMDSGSGSEEYN